MACLAVVGCGGAASGPAATFPSPAPAAVSEPCNAGIVGMGGARPDIPTTVVGTVVARETPGGCSFEVHATDGTTTPPPPCDLKDRQGSLGRAACALDGDYLWPADPHADDAAKAVELEVGRYSAPDARADLTLLCMPLADLATRVKGKKLDPSTLDPSQEAMVRAFVLGQTLTSRRWRTWLVEARDHRDASRATMLEAAKAAGVPCDSRWP
jgi:hypothetical protein